MGQRDTGVTSSRALAPIVRYWNAITAVASVVAVGAFTLIPPLQEYVDAAVFACAVAVIMLLVEIRVELDPHTRQRGATAYESMRHARPEILRRIRAVIAESGRQGADIVIVGGRIRSITDLLRDVGDDLDHGPLSSSANVRITVWALDPAYVSSWKLPGELNDDERAARDRDYGAAIGAAVRELQSLFGRQGIRARGNNIRVNVYSERPTFYCFLLNHEYLFWGFFTWDRSAADLVGPANRCYFMSRENKEFPHVYHWLLNRTHLYEGAMDADGN